MKKIIETTNIEKYTNSIFLYNPIIRSLRNNEINNTERDIYMFLKK